MRRAWEREREDLLVLVLTPIVTWLFFVLVHGWNGLALLAGHDGTGSILLVDRLRDAAGDWRAAYYTPAWMGGAPHVGLYGAPPVFALAGLWRLASVPALNLAVIMTQTLAAVLGVRASAEIARAWLDEPGAPAAAADAWTLVGLAPLFAFAPTLASRLGFGHFNIAWGLVGVLAAIALVAAAKTGRVSVTLALAATVAFAHALQTHAQQLIVYSLVFGAPVVAVAFWTGRWERPSSRALVPLLVVACVALAWSAPRLIATARFFSGTDSVRTIAHALVYDYLRSVPRDWLSSLTWVPEVIPTHRPWQTWHEVHYAFGPPLLLLFSVRRRGRALAIAAALSLLLAMAFADGVPPATALLRLPWMSAFRVPARAVYPANMFCLTLAGAALVARVRAARDLRGRLLPIAALALAFLPPRAAELLAWGLASWVLIGERVAVPATWRDASFRVAPVALAALSVSASGAKLAKPFIPSIELEERVEARARAIRAAAPELASPLTRASLLAFAGGVFTTNVGLTHGIGTLDGYGHPLRRFGALTRALGIESDDSTAIPPDSPAFGVLAALYDVRLVVVPRGSLMTTFRPAPTTGPAWFSQRIEPVASFDALGARLKAAPTAPALLREVALLVSDDPREPSDMRVDAGCERARAGAPSVSPRDGSVRLAVTLEARCPLTVALNWLETTRVFAVRNGATEPLPSYPVYGALTGAIVPPGATEVLVRNDLSP
jgi:hypothetical protein